MPQLAAREVLVVVAVEVLVAVVTMAVEVEVVVVVVVVEWKSRKTKKKKLEEGGRGLGKELRSSHVVPRIFSIVRWPCHFSRSKGLKFSTCGFGLFSLYHVGVEPLLPRGCLLSTSWVTLFQALLSRGCLLSISWVTLFQASVKYFTISSCCGDCGSDE